MLPIKCIEYNGGGGIRNTILIFCYNISCSQVSQKILDFFFIVLGGLLCFNLRCGELDDYHVTMSELEKAGRWELVSKKVVPFFESDDMPKETLAFVYKVLSN